MIYHVLTESEPLSERAGGAIARWVANVITPGPEMAVCPVDDRTYAVPERFVRVSRKLKRLSGWRQRLPDRILGQLSKAAFHSFAKSLEPDDMVWIHNRPAYACAFIELIQGDAVRVVLHMHNSHLLDCPRRQLEILQHVPIVFCSRFLRDEATRLFTAQTDARYVLYNGADARRFYQSDRRDNAIPHIAFVGRIVPEKGAHILAEAMGILEKEGVKAFCSIVGSAGSGTSAETAYMKRLRTRLPNNCKMTGYLCGEQVAAHLRQSDIFCCPSVWQEPFGMTNLEAMACGLPIVASNVGGIPEVFQYGGGVLVPPGDAHALADALRKVILDREYRSRLGDQAAGAFNSHFTWPKIREQYESILAEIVG